jgi:IS4 transposase
VREHGADKYSKGFGCWDQLVAMVYGQLSGASSLRVLEAGFNAQHTHHYHLGTKALRRSTLADANANAERRLEVFEQAARGLMGQVGRRLRREGEQLLYLLDSSSITLKGPGFDAWTGANATRNTQGVKLHVLYEAHSQAPCVHSITAANVNDIEHGRALTIEPGAMYVFDKGYCDYNWWASIDAQQAYFVTRFKDNAGVRLVRALPIPAEAAAEVLEDQLVRFAHKRPRGGHRNNYQKPLRRIVIARPEKATPLVLATNDLNAPAQLIARRYKDRWQIELFFKWIKQHLRIKRFLGRSEAAVRLQILTALIAYLLVALYRQATGQTETLWMVLSKVRATLFQRPGIEAEMRRRRKQRQHELALRQVDLFA